MKKSLFTVLLLASMTALGDVERVPLEQCNLEKASVLLENYLNTYGPITEQQMAEARPMIGADATQFEYVVKYIMSYRWTCAYQKPDAGPVNLARVRSLSAALSCIPMSGSTLVASFSLWASLCMDELNSSYEIKKRAN